MIAEARNAGFVRDFIVVALVVTHCAIACGRNVPPRSTHSSNRLGDIANLVVLRLTFCNNVDRKIFEISEATELAASRGNPSCLMKSACF